MCSPCIDVSSPPPFSLLAEVYIDTRDKPERASFILLDPDHSKFSESVYINHQLVEGRDGQFHQQHWIFKDINLTATFEKMEIGGNRDSNKDPKVSRALNLMDPRQESLTDSSTAGIGRVVVKIKRVVLEGDCMEREHIPDHKEEDDDFNMDMSKSGISHRAG
jgi:hypothetical protein